MQSGIEKIVANPVESWQRASMQEVPVSVSSDTALFGSILSAGYTPAMSRLFSPEEFQTLERCLTHRGLEGQKAAVYGAGTFGLHLAMALSEAGADVTIYSSRAPAAMARAIGILEPQGDDVESYYHGSLPYFAELERLGAPIRMAEVVYYYKDKPDAEFLAELARMPEANFKVTDTEKFDCKVRVSFDGYIMSGSEMRNFYTQILNDRGVKFVEQEIHAIAPLPGHLTFSALGLGRKEMKGDQKVDLPGNRGQVITVEGTEVPDLLHHFPELRHGGSVGIPTKEGSVNIVLQYGNPAMIERPMLIIGPTKQPGSSFELPRENDFTFLMNGIRQLWPELHNRLVSSEQTPADEIGSGGLNWSTYVCVRPGGGKSPFAIKDVDGCIDIQCAGGMGNTLAPAATLKALSLAIERARI